MIRSWFKSASTKAIGWVAVIAAIVLIAVPTAIWFGAASLIFETPQEGLRSFFIVLAIGAFLIVVELISDLVKEKTKNKR
ncbi:hypothetical protein [Brevibacterium gallinarum]|uniref:Uncharacterized protein n=1 Tax=Brevibacterium gallinarum TaxID=2762220 RepID=A0ABR8WTS6_9MICO|nr:hypothetical protein [Brevibacterium gallinarum]MBD8020477.1 hypothetical protein [Brevibacterium gallinarum]